MKTMTSSVSAYLMSFGAIAAMTSVALMAISLSTDNWTHIAVDKSKVSQDKESMFKEPRYFDRVEGIFRVCFPHGEKPLTEEIYLNPVEEWCVNQDYINNVWTDEKWSNRLTRYGTIWYHICRSTLAIFCLYFVLVSIGCICGFLGCWKASGEHLRATAFMFLLAFLSGVSVIGLWHWKRYLETEKVKDERLNLFNIWPSSLKEATTMTLGWSYIACWISTCLALLASISFCCSSIAITQEFRDLKVRHVSRALLNYSTRRHYEPYTNNFNQRNSLNQVTDDDHHLCSLNETNDHLNFSKCSKHQPEVVDHTIKASTGIGPLSQRYNQIVREFEDSSQVI